MVESFRRRQEGDDEERRSHTGGLLPCHPGGGQGGGFGCDICLFAVIYITPAWTRGDGLAAAAEEEEEEEKGWSGGGKMRGF